MLWAGLVWYVATRLVILGFFWRPCSAGYPRRGHQTEPPCVVRSLLVQPSKLKLHSAYVEWQSAMLYRGHHSIGPRCYTYGHYRLATQSSGRLSRWGSCMLVDHTVAKGTRNATPECMTLRLSGCLIFITFVRYHTPVRILRERGRGRGRGRGVYICNPDTLGGLERGTENPLARMT